MDGNSLTPQEEKLEALRKILPEAFAEGKIDFEKLKATLGGDVNFSNERYVLNWAGKSDAFKVLQTPSPKTLIPVRDESINFDETENIFIEGENLEVLKVLQKSYFGKVKMIYIDPPYNTGNDSFIYPDKFSETISEYERRVGDKDEDGYMTKDGMFRKNSKENGQYHSNWLNMMMPRLYLAKNLLRQDGVIFISIDDNEVHNLRLLMNEIFGEENFLGQFVINSTPNARDYGHIGKMHEYCMFYGKNNLLSETNLIEDKEKLFKYMDNIGSFNVHPLYNSNVAFTDVNRPNLYYPFYLNLDNKIENDFYEIALHPFKNGLEIYPPRSVRDGVQFVWRWGREKSFSELNKNIIGYKAENGEYRIVQKMRTCEKLIRSLLLEKEFTTRRGTSEAEEILGRKFFSFPKPISLVTLFLKAGLSGADYVLDFFAGSGTTAHAVMELNKQDGGNRKYICVQLPELCDEMSEAYKAGYRTIADIAKERIRRAGKKIQDEINEEQKNLKNQIEFEKFKAAKIDLGFKVLKLADSNFKQWRGDIKDVQTLMEQISLFVDPLSETATIENMVYEFLLKTGKNLNSKIESKNDYFIINDNELALMLSRVSQQIIDAVIAEKPAKVIVLDKLFMGDDQLKTNMVLQMKDVGIEFESV